MALNDNAVLVPGTGAVWTHDTLGTTKPTVAQLTTFVSAGTVVAGWVHLGHTDLDDILAPGQDGGDTEVKGSWQNKSLRSVTTEAASDFFVIKAIQVAESDAKILNLYYGGGVAVADGFEVPDNGTAQNKAVVIVMIDGTTPTAIYMPKASIWRESEIEFDPEDYAKFPLRITPLKHSTSPLMTWINDVYVAP